GRDGEGLRFTFLPFYLFTFKKLGRAGLLEKMGQLDFSLFVFRFSLTSKPHAEKMANCLFFWQFLCKFARYIRCLTRRRGQASRQ
ncbi:MAG: hypothetical protein PUC81_00215, partial [Prevotellaceae bacterium]|nr:hypothetical protein [Prevotellaceae bacterium]